MGELHVILGAGQIGTMLAELLVQRGHRVRMVRRGAGSVDLPGVELLRGDLSNLDFAAQVGRDARVVYQCTNPVYTAWAKELLPLAEGAVAAAGASGARLVVLDNLYAYGRSQPMHEDLAMKPCSRKGALRKRQAERFAEARATGLDVSLVRAADFVGPQIAQGMLTMPRNVNKFLSGGAVELMGDPDQPHAFSFGGDVVRALARTGELSGTPFVLHVPTLPARAPRSWVQAIANRLGHPGTVKRLPTWMLSTLGLVWPMGRELAEMAYQFEAPFLLESERSARVLGLQATPFEQQVEQTAAWMANQRPAAAA